MVNKSSIRDVSIVNFKKIDKRGDYKYSVLISIMLGVMVLVFSLYFIFNELWSEEDGEREICRQSIMLRAALPDVTLKGIANTGSFKDSYPLKCKTKVVEVDRGDIEFENGVLRSEKIGEVMAECWALFDKGDSSAFPSKFFDSSSCVPCARLHLSEDAKEEFKGSQIDIRGSLDMAMTKDYSYYVYLKNSGKKFSAFDFGNNVSFDLEGEEFEVEGNETFWEGMSWEIVSLKNKLNGGESFIKMKTTDISLPKLFYVDDGDLLINYGIVTMSDEDFGNYVPYLFYFQPERGDPFGETGESFIFNFLKKNIGFCKTWEGIPA